MHEYVMCKKETTKQILKAI